MGSEAHNTQLDQTRGSAAAERPPRPRPPSRPASATVRESAPRRRQPALRTLVETLLGGVFGAVIAGSIVWLALELGARVNQGDALLGAIALACLLAAVAAILGSIRPPSSGRS
jgi:predicted lipid-binding transport protein (Tim44 family)